MKINNIITREGLLGIEWEDDVLGWGGRIDIVINDNKVIIDSETLGREFVMKILEQVVDNAKMDYE